MKLNLTSFVTCKCLLPIAYKKCQAEFIETGASGYLPARCKLSLTNQILIKNAHTKSIHTLLRRRGKYF